MATEIIPPIVTLVVFVFATAFTAYKAYRHGTWIFWSLILSGIFLIVGYSIRAAWYNQGYVDIYEEPGYMFLTLIFDSFAALSLTHTLFTLFVRLVWHASPPALLTARKPLLFHPRYAFRWMNAFLVLFALVQCVPIWVFVWAALVAQTILLLVFIGFVVRFKKVVLGGKGTVETEKERKLLVCVGVVGGLLTGRSILVWIWILLGWTDTFFVTFILNALPVFVCFILLNVYHPSAYLPSNYTRFRLDKDSALATKNADARVAQLTRDAYLAANSSDASSGRRMEMA
ncbi:hypothetical protein BFW01_g12515 [Lasiodiplodia theobromae]|uniref:Uncharacterized protein n=1 Tax=Lasiodiplodia theobromae TaxID=45133 RepID=A0A5N5DLL0_9PEZI|nr:Rta1 domain protein [Lasiodiplodia theobromae]KAB2578480.1 hypothetical protein DBV05_g2756 [Lasiodiplodia theobromae]KAF4542591.1 Rta1 domain protein [Lasiodiplodia theobromae]KAF9640709.1 hypothetical protein BFW01_g12515 [Lasiodiplodia theobromae]